MDISPKKISLAIKSRNSARKQGEFLKRLGDLLKEGFSVNESLAFLKKVSQKETLDWANTIEKEYFIGNPIYNSLQTLGFSQRVCSQIYLSTLHGRFHETVYLCGAQLLKQAERKKKLSQILNYPIMLVLFMVGMLMLMRFVLLPHIQSMTQGVSGDFLTNFILKLIEFSPHIIILGLAVGLISTLVFNRYFSSKTEIEKLNFLMKFPIISTLTSLYHSQYIAQEWGFLISGGCNLREVVEIFKDTETSKLISELGFYFEEELLKGREIENALDDLAFIQPAMKEVVMHGQYSSHLGKELLIYSNQCEEELKQKIEKVMEFIQPAVFIAIAIMVIAIYGSILLPTFSLMEGI